MARPGLLTHRKFIRLARLLDSDALAMGHLEIIWQASYESGDSNLGTPADLEYLARWRGANGALASALLESEFLDECEDGTLEVHDLMDHAPSYVVKRMEREEERRTKGKSLSELRAAAGRKGGKSRKRKQVASKRTPVVPESEANGRTPAPAPAPAPAPSTQHPAPNAHTTPNGGVREKHSYTSDFETWYSHYPRKEAKQAAATAFGRALKRIQTDKSLDRKESLDWLVAITIRFAESPKARGEYVPHPATWLNEGRYDDDQKQWQKSDSTTDPRGTINTANAYLKAQGIT